MVPYTRRPNIVADDNPSPSDRNSGSSTCPSDYEVVDPPSNDMTSSMVSTQSATEDSNTIKSLELENSLLKNEIQSLNSEVSSLLHRTKQAEAGGLTFNLSFTRVC